MKFYQRLLPLLGILLLAGCSRKGHVDLSDLQVTADQPLYTTYAASTERSQFLLDEGYHLQYDSPGLPLALTTDNAGEWLFLISEDGVTPMNPDAFTKPPTILISYPDMVHYRWQPIEDLEVECSFVVHSSRIAIQEITVHNLARQPRTIQITNLLTSDKAPFSQVQLSDNRCDFQHVEPSDGWTKRHNIPHINTVQDLFLTQGDVKMTTVAARTLEELVEGLSAGGATAFPPTHEVGAVAFTQSLAMKPFARRSFRFIRAVAPAGQEIDPLASIASSLFDANLDHYLLENERFFAKIPELNSSDRSLQLLYHSSWVMMRQQMMPPEGQATTNYYLFSREPTWGWGHGGQVFHESLAMLAYQRLDPLTSRESQRLYASRQEESGYINYRTGPYLNERIVTDGQLTTSAPWYAWENWELYRDSGDRLFLEQMYASSRRFHDWYVSHRDIDNDGLCEWGGHAILESVRDASAVVWDEVGWPAEFDALDLNCMLVMEERALASMALELKLTSEAETWGMMADERAELIRQKMWDDESGFFYHIDRRDDDFSYAAPNDLKRLEIIGLLPLWAGVATKRQATRIVSEHLLNPDEFWRPYGVPSLAANDPSYDPKGYWNGPVWVQWNDLVVRGLLDYGYTTEAQELTRRVASGMTDVLRRDHTLWEFYSPDEPWGGWHETYVWAGIINDMLLLTQEK